MSHVVLHCQVTGVKSFHCFSFPTVLVYFEICDVYLKDPAPGTEWLGMYRHFIKKRPPPGLKREVLANMSLSIFKSQK